MTEVIVTHSAAFVKEKLQNAEAGHDWWHIFRVWELTRRILRKEKADEMVCEIAALFHDIADHKFSETENEGSLITEKFLRENKLEDKKIQKIIAIIENISFSSSIDGNINNSIEFKIVQDADRLDALGAIGIARAFHYGGFKNRKIFDPDIHPRKYRSSQEYLKSDAPTINHFHEKLFLLKNLMNTVTAKEIAVERHRYMEEYLLRFYDEWHGRS